MLNTDEKRTSLFTMITRVAFAAIITLIVACQADEKSTLYEDFTLHTLETGNILKKYSEVKDASDFRLPRTIFPVSYELMLLPQIDPEGSNRLFSFSGIMKIYATVKTATSTVVFHSGNIKINTVTITINSKNPEILRSDYEPNTEKYSVKLQEIIKAGTNITIAVSYSGTSYDGMIGFYRSSYIDSNNKIKSLGTTQFQTTHARHTFPCFDEPDFKAKFTIRILRDPKLICLSNMPLKSSVKQGTGKYWDTFEQSIKMSTYLVGFVISDFQSLQSGNVRVWARPNAIDQAKYALNIGTRALDYLAKLFGQEYQIAKMDMVAVPDFSAGAMENWGLITYRETRMLYDGNYSSAAAQQSVASVIVHECTHMWFGNLVTPEWWSYLWLSEAFARYYQYIGTAAIETSWRMEQQFVVEQHQTAFTVDGLESSQPMTRDIPSHSEISGMGDSITYSKGASIVRMMNLFFGQDVFIKALRNYLSNNKYGIAKPENLYEALQVQSDRHGMKLDTSVQNIMDTWTRKAGFPVVTVTIDKTGRAKLRQKRFLLRNLHSTPTDRVWWVPITWATESNPDFDTTPKYWLGGEAGEIDVGVKRGEWIIFNVQEAGFYRVNYDVDTWNIIINALNSQRFHVIHELNRAAIVDDLLNLARAGELKYEIALEGLEYIKEETNYLPFKAAFNAINYLNRRFAGRQDEWVFTGHITTLIRDIYEKLDFDDKPDDDRLTILLRREVNTMACKLSHTKCLSKSMKYFTKWKRLSIPVPVNQRSTAYCAAIKHGSPEDWEFLWSQYLLSNSATEQTVILSALGCSEDTVVLEKYLNYALTSWEENRIRRQDSISVFSAVYSSSLLGAEYMLDFIDVNHEKMAKFFGGYGTIASILSGASQYFSTKRLVEKFEHLIESHKTDFSSILTSLNSSLELSKYELEWYDEYAPPIITWILRKSVQPDTTPSSETNITDWTSSDLTTDTSVPIISTKPTGSSPTGETSTTGISIPTEISTTPKQNSTSIPTVVTDPTSIPSTTITKPITPTITSPIPSSSATPGSTTTSTPTTTPTPTITISTPPSTDASGSTSFTMSATPPVISSTATSNFTPTVTTPIATSTTTANVTIPTAPTTTVFPTTNGEGFPTTPDNSDGNDDKNNTLDYRLPKRIIPLMYNLTVIPYLEVDNFTFDGTVYIIAEIVEKTDEIILHSAEIVHRNIAVSRDGQNYYAHDKYLAPYNFLIIKLHEEMPSGSKINIRISYSGVLNKEMRGFYRSSYLDSDGITRWLAATHLEPVGARKMLPCFDEPSFKAIFSVNVKIASGYGAISNMPQRKSFLLQDGTKFITFEDTPKMSTYLLALIVSDFDVLRDTTNPYAVWARPNGIDQATYALSLMKPLVQFFEQAFGHDYQLPRLEMAALPDFTSGAMENWGLLTYRETNMLFDINHSASSSEQSIANVISHEISHQWFGNLVSPAWWKYLWLNEGFARYFQYFGTAKVKTSWSLQSQFVVEQLHSAFATDSLTSSHPMSHDVSSPAEIQGIFDAISYAKSASILRMVEKTFGTKVFYSALHDYLEDRQYDVATPEDLYKALQNNMKDLELKDSMKTIMDTWTTQTGYPIVHVSIHHNVVTLSQERFILRQDTDFQKNNTWYVPISWTNQNEPNFAYTKPKHWLVDNEETFELHEDGGTQWFIFNIQQAGYYRVNYDEKLWLRIIDLLKSDKFEIIHEINRAALMDDLLNLGRSGYVDYGIVLNATQYLTQETNYIPWRAFFNGLSYLHKRFTGQYIYDLYKKHVITLLKPIYERLGFEDKSGDKHVDKLLRRYIIEWACTLEDGTNCVSSALNYFDLWTKGKINVIPVNSRSTVYCTAMKNATFEQWNYMWKQYLDTNVSTEKLVILKALACSQDRKNLHTLLRYAITEGSGIRYQDSAKVFSAVYDSSLVGLNYTMEFVEKYYVDMLKYFGNESKIKSIINGVAQRIPTKGYLDKFETFACKLSKNVPALSSSLQAYMKRAHYELIWYNEYSPRIYEWLDRTYPNEDYRLPTIIEPLGYDLYLSPKLEESSFNGKVRIDLRINRNTSSIVLNADTLHIQYISIYSTLRNELSSAKSSIQPRSFKVSSYFTNSTTQKLSVYLNETIPVGSLVTAEISYSGILNDDMKGFYRSYYVNSKGSGRWIAVTQFQPTYARMAFPCFDEPSFKSYFTINIERPNHYISLSNMPQRTNYTSTTPDHTWDSYMRTQLMSSYLVAFAVCDFESISNDDKSVSVWGRSAIVKHGEYALQLGVQHINILTDFTAIKYPLPKLDLIGIPDFSGGAMENWGLATFREYGLFSHQSVTSTKYTDYLNTIISHELTHMWFGNLVTCEWWEYIWLNEGFAEYFQWIVSDISEPTWHLLEKFVVYELQVAMETDAVASTRPMNHPVATPREIKAAFDTIAYAKSASVIRMLHHAFGTDVFTYALHDYLTTHQFSTVRPDDLWQAFQVQVQRRGSLENWNVSVKTIMDSWANQPGYPVVHATLDSRMGLVLSQEPFVLSGKSPHRSFWIPITVTSQSSPDFEKTSVSLWLGSERREMQLNPNDDWFIINVRQTGYYRVNYDQQSWLRLIKVLKSDRFLEIHEINRAQIIDDLLNLARANYISYYDLTLEATRYLAKERSLLPWKAFFNGATFLAQRFEGQHTRVLFAQHVLALAKESFQRLGFDDTPEENHFDGLNRELILSWTCKYDHVECTKGALQRFDAWRNNPKKLISPNAKPAVYCTAVKYGNISNWAFLWNQYLNTNFASEKIIILNALGCARNGDLLNDYLKEAISSKKNIRKQDVSTVFASVYNADKFGLEIALEFLINNYYEVYDYYGTWKEVARLFSNVAGRISTEEQVKKLKIFVTSHRMELNEISASLESSLAMAQANYKWYMDHYLLIDAWLWKTYDGMENQRSSAANNFSGHLSHILLLTFFAYLFLTYC